MFAPFLTRRRWWTLEAIPFVGSVVGITLGITTFVVLGYQLYASQIPSPLGQAVWYLLFLNAVLLVTLSLLAFDLHRRDVMCHDAQCLVERLNGEINQKSSEWTRLNARVLSTGDKLHHLSIVYIDLLTYLKTESLGVNLDDVRDRSNSYLISMLNCFTAACDIYTNDKCSSCIKILTDHIERDDLAPTGRMPQHLWTHVRDEQANPQRKIADESLIPYPYHYSSNTAFSKVMNPEYHDDFWYHNDLRSLGSEYRNVNPHWRRYYNATAVVAIKSAHAKRGHGVIGFLCVDNNDGRFDDQGCRLIMATLSNMLFHIYGELWRVGENTLQDEGGTSV